MSGLGRLLAMQSMTGDTARAHAQDEWRALHRRPDALPLIEEADSTMADRESSRQQTLILRRLITRFGHR